MNPKRTPLSDEEKEKCKILYASGKTINAVSQSLHRSAHTVKKFLCRPEVVKEVGVQREELATMFDSITHRTLSGVTDEDIKKSSLLQKMTAAGISIDKALLLRGQATEVVDVRVLLDVAGLIRARRDQEDQQWEQTHALHTPSVVQPLLPAPSTEPIPTPIPAPSKAELHPTAPNPQVKYYTPNPIEPPENESPLLHGLFNPT